MPETVKKSPVEQPEVQPKPAEITQKQSPKTDPKRVGVGPFGPFYL